MPSYSDNQLDRHVNTDLMRVCKCIIPYLDRDIQKTVAVGLKLVELMNTINIYNDTSVVNELTLTRGENWEADLLRNVRSNLSPEKAYLIDAVLKLKEVRSIINAKPDNQPTPPNDPPPTHTPTPDIQTAFYNDPSPTYTDPTPAYTDSASTYTNPTPTYTDPTSNYSRPGGNYTDHNTHPNQPQTPPATPKTPPISPANLIQAISPLLDDNQKQLLNLFTGLINK